MDSETSENNKIIRVAEKYGLEGIGQRLETRWTAEGPDRKSLRELADEFNKTVLRSAVDQEVLLDSNIENIYQILTEKEKNETDRIRIQRRLERGGVDPEELRDDFVSHQTIYKYLKRFRGADSPEPRGDIVEKKVDTVGQLEGRTAAIADQSIKEITNSGELTIGEYRVLVNTQVICQSCGSAYEFTTLLERGGCDCQ